MIRWITGFTLFLIIPFVPLAANYCFRHQILEIVDSGIWGISAGLLCVWLFVAGTLTIIGKHLDV